MSTGTGAFATPGEGEQVAGGLLTLKKGKRKQTIKEVIDILDKIIKENNGRNC